MIRWRLLGWPTGGCGGCPPGAGHSRRINRLACGIALGGGLATASCEVLVAHLAEPDLGETLRAARTVFGILAVLGGCAVWSFGEAWVLPRRGLRS